MTVRTTVEVRAAAPPDAAAIARIQVRSWQGAHRGLLPDDFLAALSVDERVAGWDRALRVPSGAACTLLAELGGRPAGFAHVEPGPVGDAPPLLGALYVDPDDWGRGVGRALMAAALATLRAEGYREVALWVIGGNDRARRFYEALGWSHDGTSRTERMGQAEVTLVGYRIDLRTGP